MIHVILHPKRNEDNEVERTRKAELRKAEYLAASGFGVQWFACNELLQTFFVSFFLLILTSKTSRCRMSDVKLKANKVVD